MQRTVQFSAYSAGEWSDLCVPRTWKGDGSRPVVIFAHGLFGGALTHRSIHPEVKQIVAANFMVSSCTLGGDTFGNPTFEDRVEKAFDFAVEHGASEEGFLLYGASMGGGGILNYVRHYPEKVKAGVALLPLIDLDHFHDNDFFGAADLIEDAFAAHGGYETAEPEYNLAKNTEDYHDLRPLRIYAAEDDEPCPWDITEEFAIAAHVNLTNLGDIGHTFPVPGLPTDEIIDFLKEHA